MMSITNSREDSDNNWVFRVLRGLILDNKNIIGE